MKSMAEIFRSYCQFDAQGRHQNGTDRQSNHAYGDAYESLFPDRHAVKLLMEIGNADGSGMLAFREIFQDATIVGLDIHGCSCERGPRLEFHTGDQRLQESCERAAAGRLFDVIVEDAYHSLDNTLLTLFWLWPFVRPGGMYIVEEWVNVASSRKNIAALFGGTAKVQILDTIGPSGGVEPLVVLRKPELPDKYEDRDE